MKYNADATDLPVPNPFPYSASPPKTTGSTVTTLLQPITPATSLNRRLLALGETEISPEMQSALIAAHCQITGQFLYGIDRCSKSVSYYSSNVIELTGDKEGHHAITVTLLHQHDHAAFPEYSDSLERHNHDTGVIASAVADGSLHNAFQTAAELFYQASDVTDIQLVDVEYSDFNTVHSHVKLPSGSGKKHKHHKGGKKHDKDKKHDKKDKKKDHHRMLR